MTREEAIKCIQEEKLRYERAPLVNGCPMWEEWQKAIDICDMAISALRAQPAKDTNVPTNRWISVKDRLPEKTGRYLVLKNRIAPDCLGGNRTDIVILRFFVDKGFRMPIHIPDWINEEINDEVTHWQPMPEPPEM